MFGFSKNKKKDGVTSEAQSDNSRSWFKRLRQGLDKTRAKVGGGIARVFAGKRVLDAALLQELETLLLMADVGVETTAALLQALQAEVKPATDIDAALLQNALKKCMVDILAPCERILSLSATPSVLLMLGVNGAGKTTTIAKLAQHFQQQDKRVLLAAGDTFRAGAIAQLQEWADRFNTPVVAQAPGSDSASVIYDAMASARAKNMDVMIADTAGRLHTQQHLMAELKKVRRVMTKQDESAPHETILVIDASNGQNALQQARLFHEAMQLSGIILTKLDGTAKGGVIFAIARELALPIYYIGVGEQAEDLRPFEAESFVDALFDEAEIVAEC